MRAGCFRAVRHHRGERGRATFARALVASLIWVELGVYKEAVLQIVDAELRRFGISDRTEMAGNLQMEGMRGLNSGSEFGTGDMHVCLEVVGTCSGREVDEGAGVVRAGEGVHLHEGAGTLEIRRGGFDMRANEDTSVNEMTKVDIGVGLDGAGGSDGGDTVGEVHARSGKGHLREQRGGLGTCSVGVRALEVVDMVVHADKAREHGVASKVEDLRIGRYGDIMADAGDPGAADDDALVLENRRSCAVDEANVLEDLYR